MNSDKYIINSPNVENLLDKIKDKVSSGSTGGVVENTLFRIGGETNFDEHHPVQSAILSQALATLYPNKNIVSYYFIELMSEHKYGNMNTTWVLLHPNEDWSMIDLNVIEPSTVIANHSANVSFTLSKSIPDENNNARTNVIAQFESDDLWNGLLLVVLEDGII